MTSICDHTCIHTIAVFKVCYWVKKSAQGWQRILQDCSCTSESLFYFLLSLSCRCWNTILSVSRIYFAYTIIACIHIITVTHSSIYRANTQIHKETVKLSSSGSQAVGQVRIHSRSTVLLHKIWSFIFRVCSKLCIFGLWITVNFISIE